MTGVVGVKWTNITAFALYLFGQYIQVFLGHEFIEGYYDTNFYQVSVFRLGKEESIIYFLHSILIILFF